MKESELGARVAAELRLQGCTIFKLHNDAMQRGLPDYLMWSREQPVTAFELKVSASLGACLLALTPGQASVMRSMALSPHGATIAFGTERAAGVVTIRGTWSNMLRVVTEQRLDTWRIETETTTKAVKTIAAMLSGKMPRTVVNCG